MVGDRQIGGEGFDESVPGGQVRGDPPAVGKPRVDQDVGERRGRRPASVAAWACPPQGRLNDGKIRAAEKRRRADYVAQGEDSAVAPFAEAPGDGQKGCDVAEAASQLPSHQYGGQGPVPLGVKKKAGRISPGPVNALEGTTRNILPTSPRCPKTLGGDVTAITPSARS
jgi:hypothetical protein